MMVRNLKVSSQNCESRFHPAHADDDVPYGIVFFIFLWVPSYHFFVSRHKLHSLRMNEWKGCNLINCHHPKGGEAKERKELITFIFFQFFRYHFSHGVTLPFHPPFCVRIHSSQWWWWVVSWITIIINHLLNSFWQKDDFHVFRQNNILSRNIGILVMLIQLDFDAKRKEDLHISAFIHAT